MHNLVLQSLKRQFKRTQSPFRRSRPNGPPGIQISRGCELRGRHDRGHPRLWSTARGNSDLRHAPPVGSLTRSFPGSTFECGLLDSSGAFPGPLHRCRRKHPRGHKTTSRFSAPDLVEIKEKSEVRFVAPILRSDFRGHGARESPVRRYVLSRGQSSTVSGSLWASVFAT